MHHQDDNGLTLLMAVAIVAIVALIAGLLLGSGMQHYAETCATTPEATEALAEVNAARAKCGLSAFKRDEGLTKGALAAAAYRAEHRITGHTRNDFSFLPEGVTAKAAGCGALPPSWGFQACCVYERWTYAGAASCRGRDGKVYHHLFVR